MRRIVYVLLVTLLTALLAACGGNDEPTPTETPAAVSATATTAPTVTPPPPTDAPAPATPLPVPEDTTPGEPSTGSQFTSPSSVLGAFRSRGNLAISSALADGTSKSQLMSIEGAFVRTEGAAYEADESIQLSIDEGQGPETISIYKVGEDVAINAQGEWLTVGREEAGLFTMMADIFGNLMDDFVLGLDAAQNLGSEQLNGVDTTHYRIDDPQIFIQGIGGELGEGEEITSVQMDVWVANDGNYLLKYQIQASVSGATEVDEAGNEVAADQTVDWSFEIYDVGGDITVAFPADAPEPGAINIPGFEEGAFPLPEGAEIKSGMFGAEISSDLPEEEFTQFYQDAMAALGWVMTGDFGFYEVSKDDVTFSMFVSSDEETGKTVAQIFAE